MRLSCLLICSLFPATAMADPAEIVDITAVPDGAGWRFSVTLAHGDTGWEDYADGWRVELPDGTVLSTRTLFHPHVEEQPFTRSQGDIAIPSDEGEVLVRASTNVDGWAADATAFTLPIAD